MTTDIIVNAPTVTGFIDGEEIVQLRVTEKGAITSDFSTILPPHAPKQTIQLYADCLEQAVILGINMAAAIDPTPAPEGMWYVVNPQGYCFQVEPDVPIDGAFLEKQYCRVFTTSRKMAIEVRRVLGPDAGTYDEIEAFAYRIMWRDGHLYDICDRGIASKIEGDVNDYLINFVL